MVAAGVEFAEVGGIYLDRDALTYGAVGMTPSDNSDGLLLAMIARRIRKLWIGNRY